MSSGPDGSPRLEQLIARVALKDQVAFKQLYDLTVRTLLALTMRLLHDQFRAEEVLQEAYVSIWNSAGSYSSAQAAPMTWLMAISRNRAMEALRSATGERVRRVPPFVSDEDDDESRFVDTRHEVSGPLERLVQNMEATRLKRCLLALEPNQRQAIALAFYDGMTHAELADHLRAPLGTMKAGVRQGLARLKACLDGLDKSAGMAP